MLSLSTIQAVVEEYASFIGASGYMLPTFGYSEDGARPHIEIDNIGYHYVIVERGKEDSRFTTSDSEELFYHVFEDITFSLAGDYELAHRVEHQDCRRMIFQRQIELMHKLSAKWAARIAVRHEEILHACPFDDHAHMRAIHTAQLREQGYAADAAWRLACERYPLP